MDVIFTSLFGWTGGRKDHLIANDPHYLPSPRGVVRLARSAVLVHLAGDDGKDEVRVAEAISFVCSVYKVQTVEDHGVRVTLDLPETAIMQAAMLMECKRMAVALEVEAKPITQNEAAGDTPDGKKGRPQKLSLRSG